MSYKLIESTPKPSFKRFVQRSLGLDLIKGLGITLKEFFTPSTIATIKYPLEKIPLSPRYRAIHKLMRLLESGEERCIGCGLCEKICISNCIKIETGYGEDGRKKIESYTINFGRCIYCGFCAEVCPEIAIIHGERYENVSEQRAHFANKGVMLTPLDLALRGNIDEFAGFGSLSANADESVKMTPTDYVVSNSSLTQDTKIAERVDLKFAESTLDSALNAQNLVENNPSLRADSQNLRGNPPIKKTQDLQGGLPRSHSLARNDEILDSSLRLRSAQNDNAGVDSANSQNLGENNAKNTDSALDSANQTKSVESNTNSLDSAHPKQEANSSIFDEKSGLRSHERGNRTNEFIDEASGKLPDLSPKDDEFAPQKDKLC